MSVSELVTIIPKTCPYNIQRFFSAVKIEEKKNGKSFDYVFYMLAQKAEAVLTSIHNLCFG